ncbi:MAG: ATP-binding protein [Prevotella sp.]|nr:ATP-binding protein [Prevotella sp.]
MRIVQYIVLMIAAMAWGVQGMSAQEAQEKAYSDNNPLIFEDAWDYWPFAFANEEGDPKGYNVDIVKMMLERLDIPYVIRLKHYGQVKQDMADGHADLTCALKANYNNDIGFYGNAVLTQLTHSVLSPKKQAVTIRTLNDLRNHTAYVHSNGFLHNLMRQNALEKSALPYGDMKELCLNVNKTDSGKVIYNTQSLLWLINKYHLDNVRLTPMNIPYAEYHFVSGDTVLLARLDSLYETMSANNEFKAIQDKWFRHSSQEEPVFADVSFNMTLLVAVFVLGAVLIIFYRVRLMNINQMRNKAKQMFSLYIESSRITLWIYDVEHDMFRILDTAGEPTGTDYTPAMFAMFYNADDFVQVLKRIDNTVRGQQNGEKIKVRYHMPSDMHNELYYDVDIVVLAEKGGVPTQLLGVQHDVTEETLNRRHTADTHTRFKTLFNAMVMDVLHFDKDGTLININDHAMNTFEINDKNLVLNKKYNISDMAVCRPDVEYVCTITDGVEVNRTNTDRAHLLPNRKIYYESISLPLHNIEGEYRGQFEIGREQTGIVESLRHVHEQIAKLYTLTSTLNQLQVSVDKALLESNAYQAKYDVASRSLTFERGGRVVVMTEMDCIFTLHTAWRDRALRILKQMDRGANKTFKGQFCTLLRDINNNPVYYSLDAIPMFDAEGKVTYYYCLLRDRTERVAIDKRLAAETAKAQETERLQNFFIRNMNYEIRTPLNSIKGFAEMLINNNAPEEEQVFVNEVKDNTHSLLILVDDILLLSRLEANIQEFNYESIDVVGIFNALCQMGWETLLQPGVRSIVECNYEMLYGAVDVSNIGLLFSNLCALSAIYTYRGYVKASLDYHHDKLLVTVTDTGRGFDKQMANTMFTAEHDNTKGDYKTELKLMICKQLVEKFGGQFDIDSELGKGTTVWISIPFKAEHAIRKEEMEAPEDSVQQVSDATILAGSEAALLTGDIDLDSLSAEDAARLLAGSDMLKLDNDGGGGSFLDSLGF